VTGLSGKVAIHHNGFLGVLESPLLGIVNEVRVVELIRRKGEGGLAALREILRRALQFDRRLPADRDIIGEVLREYYGDETWPAPQEILPVTE
jgi:hypothetical protein